MNDGSRSRLPSRGALSVLAVASLLLASCGGSRGGPGAASARTDSDAPEVGERVAFRLPGLDGDELAPADFAGQLVVLDFWATWCVPCRAQTAILEDMAADYPPGALQVLAVNVGEDENLIREYFADEASAFPVALDRDTGFFTALGLVALPSLVLLDGEGRLVDQVTGLTDARRLRTLLAEAGLPPARI